MKAYVQGYGPIPEQQRRTASVRRPFDPVDSHWVEYSHTPEWKTTPDDAAWRCEELNRMGAHVGPHYCEFSVEELADGAVAIVCLSHPGLITPHARRPAAKAD